MLCSRQVRRFQLTPDPHPSPEGSRPRRVLPQAKRALSLEQPPLCLHLAGALCSALCLFAESPVRIRDAVALAVALDLGHSSVPRLALERIARFSLSSFVT